MVEQKTESLMEMPRTCKECYGSKKDGIPQSPFKIKAPGCWYEKAVKLKNTDEYFKTVLDMNLNLNVEQALAQLKPLCENCLRVLPKRADDVLREMRIKKVEDMIPSIKNEIGGLKVFIQDILSGNDKHIFKNEKFDTPIKNVKKNIIRQEFPDIKIEQDDVSFSSSKDEPIPISGWRRYQPNVKKENLPKYLGKLGEDFPALKPCIARVLNKQDSNCVKVTKNKRNNFMIEYKEVE